MRAPAINRLHALLLGLLAGAIAGAFLGFDTGVEEGERAGWCEGVAFSPVTVSSASIRAFCGPGGP